MDERPMQGQTPTPAQPNRSRLGMGIAATVLVFVVGGGAYAYVTIVSRQSDERSGQASSVEQSASQATKRYTSSTYGFSVAYPEGWQYQEVVRTTTSRNGLLVIVTFSPDGTMSDQSVSVAISEAKAQTPALAKPTTVNGQEALYYEDTNGERTYVVPTERYQYSLLKGSAATDEVTAAYDMLVRSFALE